MGTDPKLQEQALDWAVRTGDPRFADWESFTLWLEADPAHADAYDRIVAAVDAVAAAGLPTDAAALPQPANDEDLAQPAPRTRFGGRWGIGAMAIAACLALAVSIGLWHSGAEMQIYQTAPGEVRQIALADGSAITLGGGSRIAVDADDGRAARLDHGQALFTVHHNDAHPFRVEVGGDTLIDAGTVFDVRRAEGSTTVEVSEGAVIYNPAVQGPRLTPGSRAVRRDGSARIEVDTIPIPLIGEWREGRLTFRNARVADVAADISRASGVAFTAAPQAAERRVSGSVIVGPIQRDPATIGPILNVAVRRAGTGWVIAP